MALKRQGRPLLCASALLWARRSERRQDHQEQGNTGAACKELTEERVGRGLRMNRHVKHHRERHWCKLLITLQWHHGEGTGYLSLEGENQGRLLVGGAFDAASSLGWGELIQ